MACVPTVAKNNVRPSGLDLAAASAPIVPPAPARLSTTTTDFSASPSNSAKGRILHCAFALVRIIARPALRHLWIISSDTLTSGFLLARWQAFQRRCADPSAFPTERHP